MYKYVCALITLIVFITAGALQLRAQDTPTVTLHFEYGSYSVDQTFTVGVYLSNVNHLEGWQMDIRSDDVFAFSDVPFELDDTFMDAYSVHVNRFEEGVATFLATLNPSAEISFDSEPVHLFSIEVTAKKDLHNIQEIFTISQDFDHVLFGFTQSSLKLSDASNNPVDYTVVYDLEHELPHIELVGETTLEHEVGTPFEDPGVHYLDDHSLTVSGDVNVQKLGSYDLSYYVEDSLGQRSITLTRTVIVKDTTPPFIELNPGLDTIYVGEDHQDGGVSVSDNYDPDPALTVENDVDTSTPGQYEIQYIAEDSSGNTSTSKRIVHVINPPLTVEFSFNASMTTLSIGDRYHSGVCNIHIGESALRCVEVENDVNTDRAGQYTVYYQYTYQGRTFQVFRYIFVIDQELPSTLDFPYRKEEEYT